MPFTRAACVALCLAALAAGADKKARDKEQQAKLRRGQASYGMACARCHGEDGNAEHYPFVKPLGGIAKRLSHKEIRERLRPLEITPDEISIRSHIFTRKDLDELIAYVATL